MAAAKSSASLVDVFREFCSFGAKDAAPLMDGTKFSKLCRDMKLLDKNLTTTDVDIIFTKCKPKAERKITFEQFDVALGLLAEKKYPGAQDGVDKLKARISSGPGPLTHGATVPDTSEGTLLLTDTSRYTGTHKLRFDEEGKGRGLEGRDSVAKGKGMSPGSVSSQQAYVVGYKNEGTYAADKSSPRTETKVKKTPAKGDKTEKRPDDKAKAPSDKAPEEAASEEKDEVDKPGDKVTKAPGVKTPADKPAGTKAASKPPAAKATGEKAQEGKATGAKSQGEKKDIYDRLTDPSTYHATHKHRFDSSGKGRGLEGRDAPAKGAGMSPGSARSQASYVTGYKHEGTYGKAK